MDSNFVVQLLLLLVFLPVVITLIYISLKYGGKYMNKMSDGRLIKVIERVPLSQNSFLTVVKINNKPYVLTNGEKGAQILMELDENALENYQNSSTILNANFASVQELILNRIRGKRNNEKIQ